LQRPPCRESLEHTMPQSKRSGVPLTTLYHRDHGRRSKEEKAQGQQYLTPSEEKALEKYLKLTADLENPVRIKCLPSLVFVIARQHSTTKKATKPPNKNWAQAFQKRHPALKSRRVRAMAWERHENNIYDKIRTWLERCCSDIPLLRRPRTLKGRVCASHTMLWTHESSRKVVALLII